MEMESRLGVIGVGTGRLMTVEEGQERLLVLDEGTSGPQTRQL